MDFVFMTNEGTESAHWFPDEPGVIKHQEARGWVKSDPPKQEPFVSEHKDETVDSEWVTLFHPELNTTHEFPNNMAAIEGAYESGWRFRENVDESSDDEEVAHTKKPRKKAASKKTDDSAESAEDEKETD